MHLMDILQNSVSACSTNILVDINEDIQGQMLTFCVSDDGKGMTKEMVNKVTDPFFTTRTTRRVGLGLPLLKQNAERTGGTFELSSAPGNGTTVSSVFRTNHPDCLPLGDLPGAIMLTVAANPEISFTYNHHTVRGDYRFSTKEVEETLGGVDFRQPALYNYLKEMIAENLREIGVEPAS